MNYFRLIYNVTPFNEFCQKFEIETLKKCILLWIEYKYKYLWMNIFLITIGIWISREEPCNTFLNTKKNSKCYHLEKEN